MSRLSLLSVPALALLLACAGDVTAQESGHLKAGNLTRPCMACHKGHGVSGSPALAKSGDELCVACHSLAAQNPGRKRELGIGPGANPQDVESEFLKPYTHREARCLDCHSAHLAVQTASPDSEPGLSTGLRKGSTKRGFASEADLCLSCHGSRGPRGADVHDLRALFDPANPSYHPVLATGRSGAVPSLRPPLSVSSIINCTDCHGSDSTAGAQGPHGSRHASLLRMPYSKQDNQAETPDAYALCYGCHDRAVVMGQDAFPLHRKHVVDERSACWVCHDSHGATSGRALIRFNEPAVVTEVAPSRSGKIQFISSGPGSGACYLTCHGKNHDPLGYGAGSTLDGIALVTSGAPAPVPVSVPGTPGPKAGGLESGVPRPDGPIGQPGPPRTRDPRLDGTSPKPPE